MSWVWRNKKWGLSLLLVLGLAAGVHAHAQAVAQAPVGQEDIRRTLDYFSNRRYRGVFHLFYALPISLAEITTKTSVTGDSAMFIIEMKGFYTHTIESCFSVRTGDPYWHRWRISSIFGKKDVFARFDNENKLAEYSRKESGKKDFSLTLRFDKQAYDPLSGLVYYLSQKNRTGKLEEGTVNMTILWYAGRIYNNVAIRIIKEKDEKRRVEVASTKKVNGYAVFDESGRPLGGEGFTVPVVGWISVYDVELKKKVPQK